MMLRYCSCLSAIVLALFGLGACAWAKDPAIVNGDFEKGAAGWWGDGLKAPGGVVAEGEGGGKCLKLAGGYACQDKIALEPGQKLRLTFSVKCEGAPEAAVAVQVSYRGGDIQPGWYGAAKWNGEPALLVTGGSHDWKSFSVEIASPAGATQLLLYPRKTAGSSGFAWFDNVKIEALGQAAAAPGAAPAAGAAAGLRNGNFAAGKASWWGPAIDQKKASVVAEGPDGSPALKHTGGDFVCQDKIALKPESRYRISMKIKCQGASADSVGVQFSYRGPGVDAGWRGPARFRNEAALLATGGEHDWQEFAAVVKTPAKIEQAVLYLRRSDNSGTAWFADLKIEATDEEPSAMVEPKVIMSNGGFENAAAGWWGDGLKAGVGEVVKEGAAEGQACFRLLKGWICQDNRIVTPGQNYRVSMKIKAEEAGADSIFVQLSFRGDGVAPGWFGPQQVKMPWGTEAALYSSGGTHAWREFATVVTAPPGAAQALIYLRRKAPETGTACFDDVKIERTADRAVTAADLRRTALAQELLSAPAPEAAAAASLAGALRAGQGAKPRTLILAEGGAPRYAVYTGTAADVVTLHAAGQLAEYLGKISGANFKPLAHDGAPGQRPFLVVGRDNALTIKLCPDIAYDSLGSDGFVIRSVGPHLVLTGATPRGTMYAVNWFLDRQLGVRWLAPRYTYVPQAATLSLAPLDVRQVPQFAYREVLSDEGSDAAFAAHNLLNGRSHGPSFSPTAPEIDDWEHDWMAKGGSANFWELLPQKVYGKEHPDWYSGGQIAMMNKEMRAAMAKEVIKRLKAHPDYKKVWYNIWQMDWGWDLDPASRAFADAHGGHASAPRLDMMIDIADQVRAALPGARMAFNAYSWGFTPPDGMTVPDYLLVFPMTIHVDYRTTLNSGRNERLGADIVGWTKIARNVQVWDHIANWAGFLQPTPNLYPIGESIQWLATVPGIRGYFVEGNWNSPGGEFGALRAWLIARLTWDPRQDPRQLIGEWCDRYYGPAAPQLRAYVELMQSTAAKSDAILGQRYMPDIPLYSLDFVSAADGLFDQAEAAAATDAEMLAHVRHARMPIDYLVLIRRAEYAAAAQQRGLAWQVDTAKRRARFDQALRDNRVREYRQGGSVKELATLLDVERHPAAPDPLVKDLAPGDWVDIQDLAFMRFDTAGVVADPAASDGAAIRMIGKSSTWAMQLPIERVPKDGEWDLYAAVRVEAEPGYEGEDGVRVGSSPPMGLYNTGKIGALNDGQYHLIKVPGGPHRWRGDDRLRSIYLQAPAKPYISWVYLDRILAVRHRQ